MVVIIIWGVMACHSDRNLQYPQARKDRYLFLGHTYDWQRGGDKVDKRIERIDYSKFKGIWLGGDLCSATTEKVSTLSYLDNLFDLSSPHTKWAIGNHDLRNGNLQYITDKTKRDLHFTHTYNGICFLVMNSFMEHDVFKDSCDYKQRQVDLFLSVLDTLQSSTHLVILMHNLLWSDVDPQLTEASQRAINVDGSWMDMRCDQHSKFKDIYYPEILNVQRRGVQVIIISGDGGQYDKGYKDTVASGIQFYISGINNSFDHKNPALSEKFNSSPDSVLIFTHDLKERTLTGEFVCLDSFLLNQ